VNDRGENIEEGGRSEKNTSEQKNLLEHRKEEQNMQRGGEKSEGEKPVGAEKGGAEHAES